MGREERGGRGRREGRNRKEGSRKKGGKAEGVVDRVGPQRANPSDEALRVQLVQQLRPQAIGGVGLGRLPQGAEGAVALGLSREPWGPCGGWGALAATPDAPPHRQVCPRSALHVCWPKPPGRGGKLILSAMLPQQLLVLGGRLAVPLGACGMALDGLVGLRHFLGERGGHGVVAVRAGEGEHPFDGLEDGGERPHPLRPLHLCLSAAALSLPVEALAQELPPVSPIILGAVLRQIGRPARRGAGMPGG